ncbi:MAG: hypothetical protein AB7S56_07605 [Halothiobacillaceae bacterium]
MSEDKIYKHGRGGNDAEHQAHQADIQSLLDAHAQLRRVTEHLPNGIRTCTTSTDAALAQILQRHAQDMKARFAKGRAIRSWDPLFAMLFEQRDAIHVELIERADGLCAELTCTDLTLIPLIHAHDEAIMRFVAEGRTAAAQESPVPPKL